VSVSPEQESLGQKIGGGLLGLSLVFCSLEMVPGWGIFRLNWPTVVFVAIMAVCGSVSGLLLARRHRLPGLIGGLVGGPGALLAIAFVLERTTWTHSVILLVVGAIGALPGFLAYALLAALEDAVARSRQQRHPAPEWDKADEGPAFPSSRRKEE
jgi:hypothetical protein